MRDVYHGRDAATAECRLLAYRYILLSYVMMLEVNVSMASVTVRVDADTKQKAANIAEDLGLDLSSVTRAFYKQIVRERRIPLNLSYTTVPPATMEALDEAKNRLADGRPRFNSADEMFDSLGI